VPIGLDQGFLHDVVGEMPVAAQQVRRLVQRRGAILRERTEPFVPAAHRSSFLGLTPN
jgi:hypothetical protein